jgi:polyphenol oxidase
MFLASGSGLLAPGSEAAARWVVTDRSGGVSDGPYDSLNLGNSVGDDPAHVAANRARVAAGIGMAPADLRFMDQVHGSRVAHVGREPDGREPGGRAPEADALVTQEPGIALAVLVADCVPVLLTSSDAIAVVHAGRRGVVTGVVTAAVAALRQLGVAPANIAATVGPAICGACYEVPAAMQDEVCERVPAARSTTRQGTRGLDLRAGVVEQLREAAIESIDVSPWCTAEHHDLFSYRRDGVTGRFAALAWLPA